MEATNVLLFFIAAALVVIAAVLGHIADLLNGAIKFIRGRIK